MPSQNVLEGIQNTWANSDECVNKIQVKKMEPSLIAATCILYSNIFLLLYIIFPVQNIKKITFKQYVEINCI